MSFLYSMRHNAQYKVTCLNTLGLQVVQKSETQY